MRKINFLFSVFFLTLLFLCAVPTVCGTFNWLREYYLRQYDEVMRKYRTVYSKPADSRLEPAYQETKKSLDEKFPSKTKPASASRTAEKFLQRLLPEKKEFEDALVSVFPFRIVFSETAMGFRKFIGMQRPVEYSRQYLRPDGTLGLLPEKPGRFYPLKAILDTEKAAKEVNAKFHVVVRPAKPADLSPSLPDRSGLLIDRRIRELERSGISVWDMRSLWDRLPNRTDLFFRTDHHWNVYGAVAGAKILASMLRQEYHLDYDLNVFSPDSFQKISAQKIFLGSIGKVLTAAYVKNGSLDDFDMLVPGYETDFTVQNSRRYCERGDFSIFLSDRCWKYDPYNATPYGIWLDGDVPVVRIINHKIPPDKGKKMLFVKDSFASSMLPYLALQTREIIMIDPRSRSMKKIWNIIREEKPDFVFWIYSLVLSFEWN